MSLGKNVIRKKSHQEKQSLGKKISGKKITGKYVNRKKRLIIFFKRCGLTVERECYVDRPWLPIYQSVELLSHEPLQIFKMHHSTFLFLVVLVLEI